MKAGLRAREAGKMSDTARAPNTTPHAPFGKNELSRNSIPRSPSLRSAYPLLTATARSSALYQPLEFPAFHSPVSSYSTNSNWITRNMAPTTMEASARLNVYQ